MRSVGLTGHKKLGTARHVGVGYSLVEEIAR